MKTVSPIDKTPPAPTITVVQTLVRETAVADTGADVKERDAVRNRLNTVLKAFLASGGRVPSDFERNLDTGQAQAFHRAVSFLTDYRVEISAARAQVWKLFAIPLRLEAILTVQQAPFLTDAARATVQEFLHDAGEDTGNIVLSNRVTSLDSLESMPLNERVTLFDSVRMGTLPGNQLVLSRALPSRKSAPFLLLGAQQVNVLDVGETRALPIKAARFHLAAKSGLQCAKAVVSGPPARYSRVLRNAGLNYLNACLAEARIAHTGVSGGNDITISIPGLWLEGHGPRTVEANIDGNGIQEHLRFRVEAYDLPAMRAYARNMARNMAVRLVEPN